MEQRETAVSALEEMLEGLGFSGEAEEEPVALHRRGHWFEPSTAHHPLSYQTIQRFYAFVSTALRGD